MELLTKILNGSACEIIPEPVCELSVLLTDDAEIRKLNAQFRSKDRPTDVLSFSQLEADGPDEPAALGDLVISLETAQRQAEEYGVSLEKEFLRLSIHGILHLLGYDHEDVPEEEIRRMQAKEDELMEMVEPFAVDLFEG